MISKWLQMGDFYSRRFHFGASGGTFGAPVCFFTQKMLPKCSTNILKVPKYLRKWPQTGKSDVESGTEVLKRASKSESKSDSTNDSQDDFKNSTVCLQSLFAVPDSSYKCLQSLFVSHPAIRYQVSGIR